MEENAWTNILSVIGFIGSVASLVGVYISYKQSKDARSTAETAKEAVQNVLDKKRLAIFNEIVESGHKVENELNRQRGKKEPKFGNKLSATTAAIDSFISVVNEKKHNFPASRRDSIERSLKIINNNRKDFEDGNYFLSQALEHILQQTQNIISEVSEERQKKEYKTIT